MLSAKMIRTRFLSITEPVGRALAGGGVSPNSITGMGFVFALLAGFLFAIPQIYLAGAAISFSALMDLLDGAVARATPKFSSSLKTWNLNDSTMDRLSEIAIYAGIMYSHTAPPIIVLLSLSFWFLVVYVKAKGDSLGLAMANHLGIISRAEFLPVLVLSAFAGYIWVGVLVNLILSGVALAQRCSYVIQATRKKEGVELLRDTLKL